MLQGVVRKVLGTHHDRARKRRWPIIERVNALENRMQPLSDEALRAKTGEFRSRVAAAVSQAAFILPTQAAWYELSMDERTAERQRRRKIQQAALDELLPEAFAVVREVARRRLKMRHFDVQLLGGIMLHEGRIAEMATGEGKTLVATLSAYLNSLTGRGVHIVTVNDYLARRDARWMGPVYHALGLTVGVIQGIDPAERRQGGESLSFLYDPSFAGANDRFVHLRPVTRKEAYAADITYGQNNEFGFDYLRDNMRFTLHDWTQSEHHYAIVDEVDSILIDEARTPLIISGPAEESTDLYHRLDRVATQLKRGDMFEVDEKAHAVSLTEEGIQRCEELLGVGNLYEESNMRLVHHIHQALRAHQLYRLDKDYVIKDGEVIIVDEFTGRLMPGRRWSDGLHQAVEAKEGLDIRQENQTLASVTFQNYFRMYEKLCGMTGTASTEAHEFSQIYNLDVIAVPTNRPLIRTNHPDVIFRTEEEKFIAVAEEIVELHRAGRPVLIGTISIEKSEHLSRMLKEPGPLIARLGHAAERMRADLEKHGGALPEELRARIERGLARPAMLEEAEARAWVDALAGLGGGSPLRFRSEDLLRLVETVTTIRGGLAHSVLNAKYHEHEARIVAQAGRKGAVTIATNMAGRGTDIVLGGNPEAMAEEDIRSDEAKREAPLAEEERRAILERAQTLSESERRDVVAAGGLHILGTERHEARRIDNQLRGRAGRQGDPGSSRFYLSLDDDLMRIFGGDRLAKLMDMKLFAWEEGLPIESRLVSRSIEHAQRQVEGHNFEIRKQLLEYDNTMNRQREVIYEQRRRILEGVDLAGLIGEVIHDVADELVEAFASAELRPDTWDLDGLRQAAQQQFGVSPAFEDGESERDRLFDEVVERLREAYEAKRGELGDELMADVERRVLLSTVDRKWKDHLYMMDALREGIGLRAYGQRDPVVEYQREAYRMFQELSASIKNEAFTLLLRVRPVGEAAPMSVFARTPQQAIHPELSSRLADRFAQPPQGAPGAAGPAPVPRGAPAGPGGGGRPAPARVGPKVGRNEPCPCGSGKKFKKCHGA